MTAEPRDDLHRLVEEIVMAPGWREALRAAVAAADRENAELRANVERLTKVLGELTEGHKRECYAKLDTEVQRDDLRAQLAAAQAQLAEARSVLHEFVNVRGDFYEPRPLAAMIERLAPSLGFALRSDWRTFVSREREAATAEARLEAVRALCYRPGHRTLSPTEVLAALSAAPQPEPEFDPCVTFERDPKNVGRLVARHADDCPGCAYCPEPPASDEPARCEGFSWIGQSFAHCDACGKPYWEHTHNRQHRPGAALFAADSEMLVPITPDEAARVRAKWERPTPECRHCGGSGNAHTFDGDDLGICGTCHGTGSAAGITR